METVFKKHAAKANYFALACDILDRNAKHTHYELITNDF